ncbi:DUF2147 domain-containing protein [Asticcacaulis sp. EMRT-3]|uniref:DUF2147 domain-containing protein n=1 Tax=Asticcacaulis sp. EMRT-3 TaxID=3040349 RepID=UPI0024AF0D76|nr:DUF2147 domain-containing protein [Asticcacaulis sp. EMRT-3]MDI7776109.1 DUF2147 domain-containing protein [Asticcacaulis sp. EMRT-3]
MPTQPACLMITAALMLTTPLAAYAQSSSERAPRAASMQGVWNRGDGKARVRVGPCGDGLCAVNLWIKPGTHGEKVGDRLVLDVAPDSDGHWSGKAYDPQRNLHMSFDADVESDHMTTTGCVLKIMCKHMGWTRAAG